MNTWTDILQLIDSQDSTFLSQATHIFSFKTIRLVLVYCMVKIKWGGVVTKGTFGLRSTIGSLVNKIKSSVGWFGGNLFRKHLCPVTIILCMYIYRCSVSYHIICIESFIVPFKWNENTWKDRFLAMTQTRAIVSTVLTLFYIMTSIEYHHFTRWLL